MSTQTVTVSKEDAIEVEQVGGDLHVQGSDRQDLQANGDALHVERRTGAVSVSCAGDLILSVPRDASLNISSVGGDAELDTLTGTVELSLVGGDAILRNLDGPVRLTGMVGGETHMENVRDISMSSGKLGDRFNIAERVRRQVERATRRAESKIRRAQRTIQTSQAWGWQDEAGHGNAGSGSRSSADSNTAPTDEERMAILRMLQDRKITSEQAEKLLAALEGNA